MQDTKYSCRDAGERIQNARQQQGKGSQMFVAGELDMAYYTYRNIEQGQKAMSLEKAISIAKYYDMSLDYLLFGKEEPSPSNNQLITVLDKIIDELVKMKAMLR